MKNELIVVAPRKCPNCGASDLKDPGRDYDCPVCGGSFCTHCYEIDEKGPGNYVFCPHCKKKLFFPSHSSL